MTQNTDPGNTDGSDEESTIESNSVATNDQPSTTAVSSDYKTRGKKAASSGTGVLGHNTSSTGVAYGVEGVTDSDWGDAAGVHGSAPNGGKGVEATSTDGFAVHATTTGYTALWAETDGVPFNAVRGINNATTGFSYGIRGDTYSVNSSAHGVKGNAVSSTGASKGVTGETSGTASGAAGVKGHASAGTGVTYGVYGLTDSNYTDAAGVRAKAPNPAAAVQADGRLTVSYDEPNKFVTNRTNFPAYIENTHDGDALVLGLRTGYTGTPTDLTNFIQFQSPDGAGGNSNHGTVEGNSSGGVNYATSGADYAEFMPRRNPGEDLSAGEIVGVVGDEITTEMAEASRALVITDAPAVTGNSPGSSREAREDYECVAFTGQIPAKVRGPVEEGDVIVPSEDNDGTGVAVAPSERRPSTPIVGQAWEADDTESVSEVTVAVGIDDPAVVEAALESELDRRDERIDELESAVEALVEENERLMEQNAALHEQLEEIDERLCSIEPASTDSAIADD